MRKTLMIALLASCAATMVAAAQEPATVPSESTPPAEADRKLPDQQQQIAKKYADLEELFLKLAKISVSTDPARAALLKEAYAQSRQKDLAAQLDDLARLLGDDGALLSEVVKGQKSARLGLKAILDLLQSEDRAKKIESENRRIRGYLKRLNRIIREQQGIRGRTEGGDDPKRLAERQNEIAAKTKKLDGDIRQEAKENQADPQSGDVQDGKSKDGKSKDGKPKDGKPQDGKPQQGQPKSGQQPKDKNAQQKQQQSAEQDPARKRLRRAEERMRKAKKKLEEAKRDEALDEQQAALDELNQAKAELEEILRQLREEEVGRMLAMLEGRFRRMLDLQNEVNNQTRRLAKIPPADRQPTEAGKASRKQRDVMLMCDRALSLMREEGTSVALPEASVQVRDDMREVVRLLSRYDVGQLTQGIEQDIVAALEEIIGALEQAQQDAKNRKDKPKPPGGGGGQPGDPPLVDGLAELKMIRALQMRVNRRTRRYAALTKGDQTPGPEMLRRLDDLSERQQRIVEVTRDIVTGKNK